MAEMSAIKFTFGIAWKLFSSKAASKLKQGDVAEEQLRQLIMDEFKKLQEHLIALRRQELVAAIALLETGYTLVAYDPHTHTARGEFHEARNRAVTAFGVVADIEDKLLSIKILILATVHEFVDEKQTAKTLVLKYVRWMNSIPEVVKICEVTFEKSHWINRLTGDDKRLKVLTSLACINRSSYEFIVGLDPRFDDPGHSLTGVRRKYTQCIIYKA
eukprot:Seg4703.1 transcript_id=Seg4703.1/GoldUCD/mRNA.D3Y31 product="hypothetical protein" protein_id=Seg4703.1/GoldUCD/D3Y31